MKTKRVKPLRPRPPAPAVRPQKRPPSESEQEQIIAAARRGVDRKRPVRVELHGNELAPPHSDAVGHLIALLEALGTRSQAFLATSAGALEAATRERGTVRGSEVGLNAALALVQAIAPENELEAALAVQMAGTHSLAAEMLGKAKLTERTDHLQLYGNLAVKLQRTFTAQVEALARLRGKGQQTVRVEHVTVAPGGQAIVGDVHHYPPALPGGAETQSEDQSRAEIESHAGSEELAALPSPHPARDRVPVPRSRRKEALSNARRHEPGRPNR